MIESFSLLYMVDGVWRLVGGELWDRNKNRREGPREVTWCTANR